MSISIEDLGYLAGGSRLRRIYEHLQVQGDKVYKEAGFDFKSSWFPVYYILASTERPLSITAITDKISFTHITVKNIVRDLEERRLVNIEVNPTDKRSKVVALSPTGKALAKQLQPLWQGFAETVEDILTTGHPEVLEILKRIDEAIEQAPLNERMWQRLKREKPDSAYQIRIAKPEEYPTIGQMMVQVYAALEGFPQPDEQPAYYQKLANIGELAEQAGVDLLTAVDEAGRIGGAVVYFHDIAKYGANGTADNEENAGGFRLLAVDPATRGQGLGKKLTIACLDLARDTGKKQVVIHSTKAMQVAWGLYEKLGFVRAEELDFEQQGFPVFGFRLFL